jgi:hypothetical protein
MERILTELVTFITMGTAARASTLAARIVRFTCTASALLLAVSVTTAQAQSADEPIVNPHPKLELKETDATTAPKFARPIIPSDKLKATLVPPKPGCFHLVDNVWAEVPCATPEYMKSHNMRPPVIANSIQSTPHPGPIIQLGMPRRDVTSPLVWSAVTIELGGAPFQATETDVYTDPNNVVTKTPNSFSIQGNTNTFPCSTCSNGFPFAAVPKVSNSASAPGDIGWVQFVYQQFASGKDGSSRLCVWNVDVTVAANTNNLAGYDHLCVSPSEAGFPPQPLTGDGAVIGFAEIIGYVQCPSPSSNGGCTLWVVAQLPFAEGSGWWAMSAPDEVGLAGNWTNIGGTVYGAGSGSQAVFTNAQLQTSVAAYSCYTAPAGPTGYSPQGCVPPALNLTFGIPSLLTASPASYYPTAESNNLTNDPVTFYCDSDYDCWLNYNSTHN